MEPLKADILDLIMTQLVERYRRKGANLNGMGSGQLPGNWFGLQELSCATSGNDLLAIKYSYRMDDNLCDVLEIPAGTICVLTTVDGNSTGLDINDFDRSPDVFARIKSDLLACMSGFLLKA